MQIQMLSSFSLLSFISECSVAKFGFLTSGFWLENAQLPVTLDWKLSNQKLAVEEEPPHASLDLGNDPTGRTVISQLETLASLCASSQV